MAETLTPRYTYICNVCGSDDVTRDAWAAWDVKEQDWVLGAAFDYAYCHRCENETHLDEVALTRSSALPFPPS